MTPPNVRDLDYLGHLARESARFAAVLAETAADAPVPPCPGWTAGDLLWHLGEVQWFWGSVVQEGVRTTARAEELRAERPASRAGLREFYAAASHNLGHALATAEPDTPAWTWADDQTVGFIRRRQAHEALIHRIDAELTAGIRTAMDPQLSADGIDEALRIMHGGDLPAWGQFEAGSGRTVRVRTTDTGDSWFVALGQMTGTDPADGKSYDQPGVHVAEVDPGTLTAATVEGSAADLDCWLWRRPTIAPIDRSGESGVLSDFESAIAAGIS